MFRCKVCGEIISIKDRHRGTCPDCEAMIARVIVQKSVKGIYSGKLKFKY